MGDASEVNERTLWRGADSGRTDADTGVVEGDEVVLVVLDGFGDGDVRLIAALWFVEALIDLVSPVCSCFVNLKGTHQHDLRAQAIKVGCQVRQAIAVVLHGDELKARVLNLVRGQRLPGVHPRRRAIVDRRSLDIVQRRLVRVRETALVVLRERRGDEGEQGKKSGGGDHAGQDGRRNRKEWEGGYGEELDVETYEDNVEYIASSCRAAMNTALATGDPQS